MDIPAEWCQSYFEKSGDSFLGVVGQECEQLCNERGFMVFFVDDSVFWGVNVFGDGRYWDRVAHGLARERGCHTIRFLTQRNPATFARRYGYKVAATILEKKVDGP